MKTNFGWTVLFCLMILPARGLTAVIHVEKDGSGDYSIIQDAVEAAQWGDTIMIGPGRYCETHALHYLGRTRFTCISLDKSLTLIGAGRGVTFVEPNVQQKAEVDPAGIMCISPEVELSLSDLSIVNCPGIGVLFSPDYGGRLVVENVNIDNAWIGIVIDRTQNSRISGCEIFGTYSCIVTFEASNLTIEDNIIIHRGISLNYSSSVNILISNCRFQDCTLFIVGCRNVEVKDCLFEGMWSALVVDGTRDVFIHDVEIFWNGEGVGGLLLYAGVDTVVRDSIFHGGNRGSVRLLHYNPGLIFKNNYIFPSHSGWTVYCPVGYHGPDVWFDLTNNFWGTDDPEMVAASIHDGHNNPELDIFVDFLPMADESSSTTQTTLGALKALYR